MANQQAAVTVTGFVASDPVLGGTDNFRVLTFRMGSTRSRFNTATRQWENYGTAWVGVKAFRALAINTARSIRRGDRIIAVGVLNTDQWTTEQGEIRSRTVLEATNIGHDLTFGTTNLIKNPRPNSNNGTNGEANGGEGVNNGGGQQGTSSPMRPAQYNSGPMPGAGIDPYASSSESGPVEFDVTSDSDQPASPPPSSPETATAVDVNLSQPDADPNQAQPAAQQTYVDGFAESPERSESEF